MQHMQRQLYMYAHDAATLTEIKVADQTLILSHQVTCSNGLFACFVVALHPNNMQHMSQGQTCRGNCTHMLMMLLH